MKKSKLVRCWSVIRNGVCVFITRDKRHALQEAREWRLCGKDAKAVRGTFLPDPPKRKGAKR